MGLKVGASEGYFSIGSKYTSDGFVRDDNTNITFGKKDARDGTGYLCHEAVEADIGAQDGRLAAVLVVEGRVDDLGSAMAKKEERAQSKNQANAHTNRRKSAFQDRTLSTFSALSSWLRRRYSSARS